MAGLAPLMAAGRCDEGFEVGFGGVPLRVLAVAAGQPGAPDHSRASLSRDLA